MSEVKRLSNRNELISAMLADDEQLKNFYRFIAQNPHISLHDACQIIIERPNASVCFSFSEWTAMGRRITKGRKGIPYYNAEGYKQFVFDANDTHGDNRYSRPILPMKCLLGGLDELNDTELADDDRSDYRKIRKGVQIYLQERGEISGDAIRDKALIDGITYSLYSKTGFPKSSGIDIGGLPYSYVENAAFVKDIYTRTDMLVQDIEEAYRESIEEVKIIEDTEEETVSDESIIPTQNDEKNLVQVDSENRTFFSGYLIFTKDHYENDTFVGVDVFLGKTENFDDVNMLYDNTDNSLLFVSDNPNFEWLFWDVFYVTQQKLIDDGVFTEEDYKKYDELKNGVLADVDENGEVLFAVDDENPDSGIPFRYPNWNDEHTVEQTENIAEEHSVESEPDHPMYPLYKRYMEVQSEKPQAIVMTRLGDFFEMYGDSAIIASKTLELTLTARDVGLPDKVAMCGFPQHVTGKYLDKMLEYRGVVVIENDEEPKYILSHAEALEQNATVEKTQANPTQIESAEQITPIDEQSDDDDWRSQLADELNDIDEELDEDIDETIEVEDTPVLTERVESQPKEKSAKKNEKGIKDRKRKKPQPTLLDLAEPKEQSAEEALIERQLKYGSGIQHGKFRIFDKYQENPTVKTFADFLKKEYGIGSFGGWNGDNQDHDGKGIRMAARGEKGEYLVQVSLKWPDIAIRIADLIDDDNYLTEQEKKKYVEYKAEQNRLREQRAEEERQKNEYINKVIVSASEERKQRILDEYANTTKLVTFSEFLQNEYGVSEEQGYGFLAIYNQQGIWLYKDGNRDDFQNRIYLNWDEFSDKVCSLIENNKYITSESQAAPEFNRFKELTAKGKKIFDAYQNGYMSAPTNSMWDEVQSCNTIANGIYEVSTAGHGGIMIDAELAPHILSPEALQIGVLDGGYYCYEEDCDACIPLRELWDKGILTEASEYFTHLYVNSSRPEAQNGCVHFNDATEEEKTAHFIWWNNAINESLENWNTEYLKAHEQAEMSPEQQKIKAIVDSIVKEGTENTSEGNWIIYFDEFKDDDQFVREHIDKIAELLSNREEVVQVDIDNEGIDTTYYLDFCPNYEDTWNELEKAKDTKNTDLNGVLDQSELGGAKTRFQNNVAAIKLVNKLYAENRNPTEAEKRVLAQFVGWGGLSQAFDENNQQWKKEYAELKALLSQEDYEQARSSTLNAYYTPNDVISGVYAALDRFGVKGNNRILEPAMGTGNFFGFMPKDIADGSRLYGVELDNLTGRIAAKLYPQASVQIKGFEDTSFPNDKFDIVVGNVPFGGYGVADSDYNSYNFKVHDYFLAKSIDKVKPNGIVAIVTSKGTMDKLNPSARKYVAERAELIGAIRLPNTAFKQTAGTEAVADILFFRKRTERISTDTENIEWLGTSETAEGYEINNYFVAHPEMVLGTLTEDIGLYGGKDVTVNPDGRDLSEAIAEAVKRLPQGFYTAPETSPIQDEVEVDYNVKPMCYKADSGRLYMRMGDEMVEQRIPSYPKDAYQRLQGMIALREELHRILDIQIKGCSDEVLADEQKKLNAMYDRFVGKYGEINSQTNTRLFKDDGDSALLFACENIDEETKKISKAEVFFKRTIRPYVVPTNTDDCFEALQISRNERGKVDIAYVEELTGKDYESVLFELGDSVFRNPEKVDEADKYSGFETAEEYLSGRVVDKLHTAEAYAEHLPEYKRNVKALEQVQPTPLTASEISVRLGATWVDKELYKQFYCELVGVYWWQRSNVEMFYNPFDSSWRLDQKDSIRYDTQMKQKEVYGTQRAPAYRLLIDSMNLRATTIYDTVVDSDGKERKVLNQAETIAAREKQNQIKDLPNGYSKIPNGARNWKRHIIACSIRYDCRATTGVILNSPK